jgi:hypothetical protein
MDPNLAVEKLLSQGCDVFWFFWIFFSLSCFRSVT